MAPSAIATAADYADAMMSARRAKNWLFLILLIVLLLQLSLFFTIRYSNKVLVTAPAPLTPAVSASVDIKPGPTSRASEVEFATPGPSAAAAAPAVAESNTDLLLEYLVGLTDFLGVTLSAILAAVLLLILLIMLVGRLIGVSRVTSAFIWCLIFGVLLFPWQAYLNWPSLSAAGFKIPGVLFTWSELATSARFHDLRLTETILKWSRFVAFPVVAVILLLVIQAKSSRGVRMAFGEAEVAAEGL
ncbi:MAG TPA: hypothetical protein VIL86_19845 [Tepidisphaeraceae bacterium]|jgi:hypothetical protein